MSKVILQIPVEEELKKESEKLFNELGMDMENAVRTFLVKCLQEEGLPFGIRRPTVRRDPEGWKAFMALRKSAEENGLIGMSMEEINAEIEAVRAERRTKEMAKLDARLRRK